MSADLLAAFGFGASEKSKNNSTGGTRAIDGMTDRLVPGFETHDDLGSGARQPNIAGEDADAERDVRRQGAAELWHQHSRGQDVLFDASEEQPKEADDDFGEFEDAEAPENEPEMLLSAAVVDHKSAQRQASSVAAAPVDLLGLDETPHEGLDDGWGHFSGSLTGGTAVELPIRTTRRSQADLPEPKVMPQEEDHWEPFEDGKEITLVRPTVNEAQPSVGTMTETPMQAASIAPPPPKTASISSIGDVRPMNIPPPAVLLQVLPQVFRQLQTEARKLVDLNNTHDAGSGVVALAKDIRQAFIVAARITAGRGLRWKRDSILAQSMKIGPAGAGGGGRGMKLTAVDKTESLREEKEVADVVSEWQKNAHLFNSTLKQASIHRPLMNLYMSVKPRAGDSSALRAPHACALCGIKRDERLQQVDVDVEDSFGEYWTEHWGHRDCREFWSKYETFLSKR